MNVNAATTTHTRLALTVNQSILGINPKYGRSEAEVETFLRPLIVLGKPGIGKTVGIRALAQKKLKIGYKELRLASMSELDLAGLPLVKQDDSGVNETTYAASKLLPKESRDGEYGILVLDEITSCSRAARAVALQLLDSSRGVGEYKLPDKWICIGLGNDADDGGIFEGLEGAFLNRCRVVRLEPDYPSWEIWADENDINPSVKAFLKCFPQYFYADPIEGDVRICASPRSWEGVAAQLDFAEQLAGGPVDATDTEMFIACIAADVTPDIAAKFASFYAYKSAMISPEVVLSGNAKLEGKNAGVSESVYITIESSLAYMLKRFRGVPAAKLTEVVLEYTALEKVMKEGKATGKTVEKTYITDGEGMVANFIQFTAMLRQAKGAEAAVSGLERMFKQIQSVPELIAGKQSAKFREKYPNEFAVLCATAKSISVR